MYCLTGKHTY